MAGELIQVESGGVVIALSKLQLGLQHREEMYASMGAYMLRSVRLTFREQGSPAGSWVPLAASTIKSNPKKYGAGHQLLIDRGVLLNSITYAVTSSGVMIGTNLKYAAVHQFGSRDRTGGPIGPQARLSDRAVQVGGFSSKRLREVHYERKEITRADGSKVIVPRAMRTGKAVVIDKAGNQRTVNRLFAGPQQQIDVNTKSHAKHQNIPARPYLVFRQEDPEGLRRLAVVANKRAIAAAGLGGN